MLVPLTNEIFEAAHVFFHGGGRSAAVAPPARIDDALVRLDDMRLVAYGIPDAMMLAVRENADSLPENFEHLVAAGTRNNAVEGAVFFQERLLVALRVEDFHACN